MKLTDLTGSFKIEMIDNKTKDIYEGAFGNAIERLIAVAPLLDETNFGADSYRVS